MDYVLSLTVSVLLLCTSCNTGYEEKDGKIVLHTIDESVGHRYTELPGADPLTFETLKAPGSTYMGKDSAHVYHHTTILTGADPASFEYLGHWYYKDKNTVYFFGFYNDVNQCQLEGVDPSTFVPYGKLPWGHDAQTVYWATRAIKGIDPRKFSPVNKNWGKTDKEVIYKEDVLKSVALGSFKALNENYAMDKDNIYYGPDIVKGCDRTRFKPVSALSAHDGKYFYFGAERQGELTAGQKKLFRVK